MSDLLNINNGFLEVANGNLEGCSAVHLFGFNRLVGITYETIFNDGGGLYSFPSSAVQMSAVSSSTDTMDLRITGLDANWDVISEDITLTGTTAVTTTQSFLRINDARILTGSNAGNITISNGGTTYAYIEAEYGVHQAAIYSVPRGGKLFIKQVEFTSGTLSSNKYITARACMNQSSGAEFHFFETTFVTSQLSYRLDIPFLVPEKTDFSLEGKSSAQENELSIYIAALLAID